MEVAITSEIISGIVLVVTSYIAVVTKRKSSHDRKMKELRIEEDSARRTIDRSTRELTYLTAKKVSGGKVNGDLTRILASYEDDLDEHDKKMDEIHCRMKNL
jgi:hypothetical protein